MLLVLLLALAGCGGSGVEIVPVRGQITYGGGDWPASGDLYFTPVHAENGLPRRPGRASFDKSGRFQATTITEGDGLIPGEYIVNIECWEHRPSLEPNAPPAKSYLPPQFQAGATNGLKLEVPRGSRYPIEINFDLPSLP